MRDALGIDSHVTLNLQLSGNGIYIYPIEEFIAKIETENSYSQLLEMTKGSWGKDTEKEPTQKRMETERKASSLRKESW
jgi:hypothetical protein